MRPASLSGEGVGTRVELPFFEVARRASEESGHLQWAPAAQPLLTGAEGQRLQAGCERPHDTKPERVDVRERDIDVHRGGAGRLEPIAADLECFGGGRQRGFGVRELLRRLPGEEEVEFVEVVRVRGECGVIFEGAHLVVPGETPGSRLGAIPRQRTSPYLNNLHHSTTEGLVRVEVAAEPDTEGG